MFTVPATALVYLACGSSDLRKSIDGLAALVQEGLGLEPFSPCLFAFYNRQRNKLKILYREHNGFWLFYSRLEQGIFQWPTGNEQTMNVSSHEFRWLLDGLSLSQYQTHSEVNAKTVFKIQYFTMAISSIWGLCYEYIMYLSLVKNILSNKWN